MRVFFDFLQPSPSTKAMEYRDLLRRHLEGETFDLAAETADGFGTMLFGIVTHNASILAENELRERVARTIALNFGSDIVRWRAWDTYLLSMTDPVLIMASMRFGFYSNKASPKDALMKIVTLPSHYYLWLGDVLSHLRDDRMFHYIHEWGVSRLRFLALLHPDIGIDADPSWRMRVCLTDTRKWSTANAACLWLLIVLLCDGYFSGRVIMDHERFFVGCEKFFAVATRLPIELQAKLAIISMGAQNDSNWESRGYAFTSEVMKIAWYDVCELL
jgi:hypothetical protein